MLRRLTGGSKGKESERRMRERDRSEKERQDMEREIKESRERIKVLQEEEAKRELESQALSLRNKEEQEECEREEQEETERRKGLILGATEMSAMKVDLSMGTMGLVDRLEVHPAGKLLKNVVISNEPPADRDMNISRLRTYKPQNDFAKLSLGDVPPIKLTSDLVEFRITEAMTESQFFDLKEYVLVSDVFIHFVPLDSFFSTSCPVEFQLNDFRRVSDTRMRHYPLSCTAGYNILMTLDYCVAKKDLKYLSLSISTSLANFRKGIEWGSAKVVLTVSHMDFPVKANIQETMGVLHMSDSDLHDYISDPRSSDGVITPQALEMLKQSYKRGEIENINTPRDDKREINTARTEIQGDQSSVAVRDLISSVRKEAIGNIPKDPKKKASLKSSMKKVSVVGERDIGSDRISEWQGGVAFGIPSDDEIMPGDSNSEIFSGATEDIPRRMDTPPRSFRSTTIG